MKRGLIFAAVIGGLVLAIVIAAIVLKGFLQPAKSRVINIGGIPVLFLDGSPRDMGLEQGKALKKEIEDTVNGFIIGRVVKEQLGRNPEDLLEDIYRYVDIDKDLKDEMKGIAEGAGVSYDHIVIANLLPVILSRQDSASLHSCSLFAVEPSRSGDSRLVVGRNLDWAGSLGVKTVILVYQLRNGVSYLNITIPGIVSPLTAFNSDGIFFEENRNSSTEPLMEHRPAFPGIVRSLLGSNKTLDEFVASLTKTPRNVALNLTCASGREAKVVTIELGREDFALRNPEGGVLISTNHYLVPKMQKIGVMPSDSSLARFGRLYQLSYGGETISIDDVKDIMKDKQVFHNTVYSVVALPSDMKLYVSVGDSAGYVEIDARRLFKR